MWEELKQASLFPACFCLLLASQSIAVNSNAVTTYTVYEAKHHKNIKYDDT